MGSSRRRIASVVAAALAAAALGLLPTSAGASYFEDGVSLSTVIVRDGVTYNLNVKAVEQMGASHVLRVSISKTRDPAGPTRLRQRQKWTFELDQGEFYREGNTFYIDAGGPQEPLDVEIIAEQRPESRCSEERSLYVTKPAEGGSFRIETENEVFGTITELSDCAGYYHFSSGPPPPPPPCPVEGSEVSSINLDVKRRISSDVARLDIFRDGPRDLWGHRVSWSMELRGTLPAKRFRLNRNLEGSLRAKGAPWLDGVARFEPEGRFMEGDWFNCKKKREARSLMRRAAITGDLTLDTIGDESYRISDPDALTIRSRVRPRS